MALEAVKAAIERATGLWSPSSSQVKALVSKVVPESHRFRDDGKTPNHPCWTLIVYRGAVAVGGFDPAAVLERLFARHGWRDAWRDGVYTFNHFHTGTHEVVGVARGFVRVLYGGSKGRIVCLEAGDVAIHPAGTGHKRVGGSKDLLVVGAYPAGGSYDEPHAGKISHDEAIAPIAKVKRPAADPVYGGRGPMKKLWRV